MTDYRFSRPIRRSPSEDRTFRGVTYDSKAEMRRAVELQRLLEAGKIVAWFRQVPVSLGEDFVTRVDFLVIGIDRVWMEEVKGFDNKRWRTVVRLWAKHGPLPLAVLWDDRKSTTGWRVEKIDGGPAAATLDQADLPAEGDLLCLRT